MLRTCKNYRQRRSIAPGHVRDMQACWPWLVSASPYVLASRRIGLTEKMRIRIPNKSAPANRRPAGQSNGSGEFQRGPCSRRAFPAAVAELRRWAVQGGNSETRRADLILTRGQDD